MNGESITGKSYSEVVQLIKVSKEGLSLTVVPKHDDILQMYFSEIASNPESNQHQPPAQLDSWQLPRQQQPSSELVQQRSYVEQQQQQCSACSMSQQFPAADQQAGQASSQFSRKYDSALLAGWLAWCGVEQ